MLGLGLGINRFRQQTPLELLKKYTSAMWLPSKATGTSEGINSPFTSTVADLNGNAPLTLQGFAGTTSSGYAPVVCKNIGQEGSYTNLVTNGDFSQGTVGWENNFVTTNVVSNEIICTITTVGANRGIYKIDAVSIPSGKRCYVKAMINPKYNNSAVIELGDALVNIPTLIPNIYNNIRGIVTKSTSNNFIVYHQTDTNYSNGDSFKIKEVQVINITDNPLVQSLEAQLGRQLTVAECDYLFTFTATTASLKAKTVPFLQFDVTNDYGLASNPSLEILGTSDFGFGRVIKVPSLVTYYPFTKSESSEATTQYGLKVTNTGILSVILEGTTIQLATGLLANTVDAVWVERISGVLKCFINGVEVFSVANTTSLTSRPNFRVGALSTNVGGTTHTGFSNEALGSLVIVKTDVLKARLAWFKFTMQTFGI